MALLLLWPDGTWRESFIPCVPGVASDTSAESIHHMLYTSRFAKDVQNKLFRILQIAQIGVDATRTDGAAGNDRMVAQTCWWPWLSNTL